MRTLCLLLVMLSGGCKTGVVEKSPASIDAEMIGARWSLVDKVLNDLGGRIGKIEGEMVEIRETIALVNSSQELTAGDIKSLLASNNSGPFSGSGVYACLALALVLTFELVLIVLWWKLQRTVRRNGVACKPASSGDNSRGALAHPNEFPAVTENVG